MYHKPKEIIYKDFLSQRTQKMLKSTRCAVCKSLRKRCPKDCIFSPYFPGNNPHRFDSVHKIYGVNNLSRALQNLPIHERAMAADCMVLEASWRITDPVYGCIGFITQLQDQIIKTQNELSQIQALLALHLAQIQQKQCTHQEHENVPIPFDNNTQVVELEPSWGKF